MSRGPPRGRPYPRDHGPIGCRRRVSRYSGRLRIDGIARTRRGRDIGGCGVRTADSERHAGRGSVPGASIEPGVRERHGGAGIADRLHRRDDERRRGRSARRIDERPSGAGDAGTPPTPADAAASASSPFGCTFAWGEPAPSSLASLGWLRFVTTWVGSEVAADGSVSSCSACGWLTGPVAATALVPVFYAYFIGFYGHANGLQDQNQNPNGPNLATGGGALILGTANGACPSGTLCDKNKIVQMYATYARQTQAAWPTKPLVWLLEGDFVQYAATSQSHPLTYAQLGQLAALITTAIKSNMPNAVVAIDHSTWNSDDVTKSFWSAMSGANYDLVWTTGVGNNAGFLSAGTDGGSYNGATATYAFLHGLTGKKILVDESAGMSQQSDTWSNQSATTLDALIANGVVAVNVSGAPPNYAANVMAIEPHIGPTCP